jgi:hypothetical protein
MTPERASECGSRRGEEAGLRVEFSARSPQRFHRSAWFHRLPILIGLLPLLLALAGCGFLRPKPGPAKVRIGSLDVGTNAAGKLEALEVLENVVTRFADTYAANIAQAVDDYSQGKITSEQRLDAARWKLSQATAAFIDASGENPVLNVLDLVVLSSISRLVMEDYVEQRLGKEATPLLEAHRRMENSLWGSINRVLTPAQQQQLRDLIAQWRQRNPNQRYAAVTRLRELAIAVGQTPQAGKTAPSSIFSLLFLDPLAGLDPTAAAIQETRRLAERAMYYTQRMPMLLNWQVQVLTLQLASQPETRQLLGDTASLTKSFEAFAEVARQLPKVVSDQREQGIQQILDGLALERTNWVAALAAEEQKVSGLLVETRQTLNAASQMATNVHGAVTKIEDFVRYVSPPDTNPAPTLTNSHPFNVLDYGKAANEIGLAAKDLNSLLLTVNQSVPSLSQQLTDSSSLAFDRAFRLGLVLILILLAGSVLAGLAYRALTLRLDLKNAPSTTSRAASASDDGTKTDLRH